jgi:phosphatidylethanolamine-binding protein (PEBP) family uncharacterized protein
MELAFCAHSLAAEPYRPGQSRMANSGNEETPMLDRTPYKLGLVLSLAAGLASSCNGGGNKTGAAGTTGVAGTTATAGTTGAAGTSASAGTTGAGGTTSAAGTGGTTGAAGGGAGTTGAGGGAAGTGGGAAGGGGASGTGGMACVGDPPVTEHNMCAAIPSAKKGDAAFTISSPDFANCGAMPATQTCDGKAFATGASPTLTWTGAPAGTMSFALVFKDISILADNNPMTERLGYHWVMWDIPATRTGLPAGLTGGYRSTEVPGALQWAGRNNYGFFPPCPNPFPRSDSRFTCSLVIDSYSFTLYALPVAKLTNLPQPDLDATSGLPTGNYVVKLAKYIDGLAALAVTEFRSTSKAWATSFAPPSPTQYPCVSFDGGAPPTPDGGTDGGAGDGGAPACLQ